MNKFTVIPHVKLHHDKCILYSEFDGYVRKKNSTSFSADDIYRCNYHGILSLSAKKKIKTIITKWMDALNTKKFISRKNNEWLKYQLTFCTLTLSANQMHDDKFIKREMLNYFFIDLKRQVNFISYLCVCERQENNNIHFHILFEKFIDWKILRSTWNKIQDKHGYIENYRQNQKYYHKDGFKLNEKLLSTWSEENQYKAYLKGVAENWSNPNSTDIKDFTEVKNIGAYVTKYVCKGVDKKVDERMALINKELHTADEMLSFRKKIFDELKDKYRINGKVWSCSENLQKLISFDEVNDNELEAILYEIFNSKDAERYDAESYTICKGNVLKALKNTSKIYYKKFCEVQNHNYQLIYNN